MTAAISHRTIETPVGTLHLAATMSGLTHLVYPAKDHGRPVGDGSLEAARIIDRVVSQLDEFFAGERRRFDLPLAPDGTDFQRAVWSALAEIPFGETRSYGELAQTIGRPGSARAVGAANGANPISVIVPCHRVIGAGGKLTGYAGGLPAKKALLELECPGA